MTGSNAPGAFAATTARRSASIDAEKRTRAIADRTAPRDLALSTSDAVDSDTL
jgi:hypothetical protein